MTASAAGKTRDAWRVLSDKAIFLSCSSDMEHAVPFVDRLVEELNARVPRGDRWTLHYWKKSDIVWPSGCTWQECIPRPSDPKVDVVICLLGERIGEPLPSSFPLPSDLPLPTWVSYPWMDSATGVPLTGTLFELLDALEGPSKERLRHRTLVYVKVDGKRFNQANLMPDDRVYGFEHHYKVLRGNAERIRNPRDDADYRRQIAWLDRFGDEFFRKPSRASICYGKGGQTPEESLKALRAKLLPDLEKLFGLAPRKGPVQLKGLSAYQPGDADILFGRDRAIERVLERLKGYTPPTVALLTGRRGEGKSSVLRAGLVGPLKRAQYRQFGRFLPVLFDSFALAGPEPLKTFTTDIDNNLPEPLWSGAHKLDDFLPNERLGKLVEAVRKSLASAPQAGCEAYRLFIAIDQFEELLVPATEDPRLAHGLYELLAALQTLTRAGLAWTVLALPSDQEQRLKDFWSGQPLNVIELAPVGEDNIRDIVAKSFDAVGMQTVLDAGVGFPEHPHLGSRRTNKDTQIIESIVAQAAEWLQRAESPGPILPLLSLLLTDLAAARHEARLKKISGDRPPLPTPEMAADLSGVLGRLGERAWSEAEKARQANPQAALSRLMRQLVMTGASECGHLKLLRNCPADHPAVANASALVQAMLTARLLYRPAPGLLRLTHVAVVDHWSPAAKWYAEDQKHQLTAAFLVERSDAWRKARSSGQTGRLVSDPEELDALEDLWLAWYDDPDRLPLEFMRTSIKWAFDPVAKPESWKRGDGNSRLIPITASNDEELLAHAISSLERLPTAKRQEIVNFASPEKKSTALMFAAWRGNTKSA